jgi:hypothetical protein
VVRGGGGFTGGLNPDQHACPKKYGISKIMNVVDKKVETFYLYSNYNTCCHPA